MYSTINGRGGEYAARRPFIVALHDKRAAGRWPGYAYTYAVYTRPGYTYVHIYMSIYINATWIYVAPSVPTKPLYSTCRPSKQRHRRVLAAPGPASPGSPAFMTRIRTTSPWQRRLVAPSGPARAGPRLVWPRAVGCRWAARWAARLSAFRWIGGTPEGSPKRSPERPPPERSPPEIQHVTPWTSPEHAATCTAPRHHAAGMHGISCPVPCGYAAHRHRRRMPAPTSHHTRTRTHLYRRGVQGEDLVALPLRVPLPPRPREPGHEATRHRPATLTDSTRPASAG